mgnify:CR=1 FL=1|jgi:hypothetical protein
MKINKRQQKIQPHMPDLTRVEGGKSVSLRLEDLIRNANKFDCEGLKREFFKILDDPTTTVSKEKIAEYKEHSKTKYTTKAMLIFITNIYCAGANMSLKL